MEGTVVVDFKIQPLCNQTSKLASTNRARCGDCGHCHAVLGTRLVGDFQPIREFWTLLSLINILSPCVQLPVTNCGEGKYPHQSVAWGQYHTSTLQAKSLQKCFPAPPTKQNQLQCIHSRRHKLVTIHVRGHKSALEILVDYCIYNSLPVMS